MKNKGVEQKPSETALIASLRRSLTNKEYGDKRFGPDHLAVHFLPPHYRFFLKFEKVRASTRAKLDGFFPGVTEFIIARTAYFDGLFAAGLNERVPQIVLLGAGYDSRAYRFADLVHETRIFELDIAPTQDRKKFCLKKAKITVPRQVTFVPIDFDRESLKDVLEKAGWHKDRKTLFLWEGVSYYLDPGSVDATLGFFCHSAHRDSLIAFDYAVSITQENKGDRDGATQFLQRMDEQHADEKLKFLIGKEGIGPFLGQRDLRIIEHLDNQEIQRRFLTRDDGSLIGHIPEHFRFVSAAPVIR